MTLLKLVADHLYYRYRPMRDIWELEEKGERKKRRTKIMNAYDNHW